MTERGALLGGRYQLDAIIGRGGMAEVWRARDIRLERDVAVKRLRVDLASDPTFQARFRREAQSAAGLNHPNIVAVYDTGEERDAVSDVSVPYIVMELVEGVTLREVLRDGRKIVPERALEFTAGVLDALAYAHRAGIVHRDIKPANVMLTPNGTVKVMDFGIARAVADTSATMTQTAAVIGTAQYLSPEQARGEKVDNRSDIYSVGCLLYELLTSQPLFKGDSPVSVAYQHVREIPVPPSQLDPEITPAMDAIVLKSLEKDARDRYQDAGEMRDDINRCLAGEPVLAMNQADQPTRMIPSDPMTTTARRGVTPAATAVTPAPVPSPIDEPPVDELPPEDEEPKSKKGLIALLVIAGLVVIGLIIGLVMLLNPPRTGPNPTPSPTPTAVSPAPSPTAEPSTPSPTPTPSPSPTPKIAVPNVIGMNETEAVGELRGLGFTYKITERASDEEAGTVIDQNPRTGEFDPGTPVELIVSTGPEQQTIPDSVLGLSVDQAEAVLTDLGFTNVKRVDADPSQESPDAAPGEVTAINPPVGSTASADTEITLTVATGNSVVPELTGIPAAAATERARNAGFQVTVEEKVVLGAQPGQVTDQNPKAGATAPRSEPITITVAKAEASPPPSASQTPGGEES
ncbi:Stk1 family PASTA domain-containing Ser/Thr kinase [Tessaracoccus flavescens]|uniref:non-specific serine/threonine protein kinase n=1 Tax=Tessaracoccus flavescens TaxID=399497 RepID=A0A1Q2CYD1_9ACTN|nr:Stk1 family PASTA domain-containing Ser/Thr kinase [Tessaracoccus flavescens]AQP51100.1 hypothetical protein BW733_09950 [Tessaracoccus flavescens]